MAHPPHISSPPRAVIIGYPVAHARSPVLHQHWLKAYGIDGAYERREVKPGDVASALQILQAEGYRGGNVTVPHKEEAFLACHRTTERARQIRAINTFWFEDGLLIGDNTDGLGFVGHLDHQVPDWAKTPPHILILGAGGAARGLILPLLERNPASITLANRSTSRGETLLKDVASFAPMTSLSLVDWEHKDRDLSQIDLLINTTSLGMAKQPPLQIDLSTLPSHAIVADIVYVPLETAMLQAATARGLRVVDGLGMLLHQGAPGFERWFGRKPEVTPALRAELVADLRPKP